MIILSKVISNLIVAFIVVLVICHFRYVLEMGLMSVDMNQSKVSDHLLVHRRLDDEHTPGVFQVKNVYNSKGVIKKYKVFLNDSQT